MSGLSLLIIIKGDFASEPGYQVSFLSITYFGLSNTSNTNGWFCLYCHLNILHELYTQLSYSLLHFVLWIWLIAKCTVLFHNLICWEGTENEIFSSFFSQRKWKILSSRKTTHTQLQLQATPLILQGTLGWQPLLKVQQLSPKKWSQKQNLQSPRKLLTASVKLIGYQE